MYNVYRAHAHIHICTHTHTHAHTHTVGLILSPYSNHKSVKTNCSFFHLIKEHYIFSTAALVRRYSSSSAVSRSKPHVNIGTIGHVDHGKTSLTAAITKGEQNGKFMTVQLVYCVCLCVCLFFCSVGRSGRG